MTRCRRLVTGLALLVAVAACAPAVAQQAGGRSAGPGAGARGRQGNFVSSCQYTHSAADDPIVHAGHPGAAHNHDFFANPSTDADSTVESLQRAGTRCDREGDTAAYWVPTMSDGGRDVHARRVAVYYQLGGRDASTVEPFPVGLKMVTEPGRGVDWACAGGGAVTHQQPSPPDCPGRGYLVMRVLFPDCWDGRNLDSADHRSHMTASSGGKCPASHPVAVPRLRLNVQYPAGAGGADVTFSTGGLETAHADFFNAWDPAAQTRLVEDCLNRALACGNYTPV